jgi:seryl-tRNA synthetase
MLDIKWIRENAEEFDRLLARRGFKAMSEEIINLDSERRQITTLMQQLQHSRKEKAKLMGMLKDKTGAEFESAKRDAEHINEKLSELMKKASMTEYLDDILDHLPNLPAEEVPVGEDENGNVLIRTHGEVIKNLEAKEHYILGEELGMMDFEQTAKISGSRFVTLTGDLARLERALISFMLDIHTKQFEFTEVSPPYLVRPLAMYNVGQLPKFADESFVTTTDYRLIPTAEVSLTNMVADTIIAREKLPLRMTAYSPCFRSEAGSHGRDTKGMFRMHQFGKVEIVSVTTPEESNAEHEYMVGAAEEVLKKLQLPYRVMLLCTGDMGAHSKKTYDIEVWLPGQNRYREISSCSNCGDFQARRMKARYKEFGASETTFVHTLNASGLAVGRTMIAILENYQNADGSITVPQALQSYMGGIDRIEKIQ